MSEVDAGIDPEATAEIPMTAGAEYEHDQTLGSSPLRAGAPVDGTEEELPDLEDPIGTAAPYQKHNDDQLAPGFDVTNFVAAMPAPGFEDVLTEDVDADEVPAADEGTLEDALPAGEEGASDALPAGEDEEIGEGDRPFGPVLEELLPEEAGFDAPLPEEVGTTYGEAGTTSQLIFVDVLIVLPSSNPVVVLQESDAPYRELRIPIGGPEGIAIGYAARRIATPRPLTHELMTLILRDFDLTLEVVRITGSSGGSFTAEIVLSGPSGSRTIDCRPSDAIALALRQRLPVPIVASVGVLEQAGSGAAGSN